MFFVSYQIKIKPDFHIYDTFQFSVPTSYTVGAPQTQGLVLPYTTQSVVCVDRGYLHKLGAAEPQAPPDLLTQQLPWGGTLNCCIFLSHGWGWKLLANSEREKNVQSPAHPMGHEKALPRLGVSRSRKRVAVRCQLLRERSLALVCVLGLRNQLFCCIWVTSGRWVGCLSLSSAFCWLFSCTWAASMFTEGNPVNSSSILWHVLENQSKWRDFDSFPCWSQGPCGLSRGTWGTKPGGAQPQSPVWDDWACKGEASLVSEGNMWPACACGRTSYLCS